MQFGIHDRLVLLQALPREGSLVTLRIVRQLREALSFSEQEHEQFKFTYPEPGRVAWDKAAEVAKEIEIGAVAREVIVSAFQALDKQKKLHLDWLPLLERFVHPEASGASAVLKLEA